MDNMGVNMDNMWDNFTKYFAINSIDRHYLADTVSSI